jgi:hypothetical protein
MTVTPYILIFIIFCAIEYVAILISSSQLKAIIHEYIQNRDIVYHRPPHPLKNFLATQKILFFLACFLTVCFGFYLRRHFLFHPEYAVGLIVIFKIFSFLVEAKKRQQPKPEDSDMAIAFQDDFTSFVNSWKANMAIEIITLFIGAIALGIIF